MDGSGSSARIVGNFFYSLFCSLSLSSTFAIILSSSLSLSFAMGFVPQELTM
jgi:hypothetical protein